MSEQDDNKDKLNPPDSFKQFYLRSARVRRDVKIRRMKHYQDLHGEYWEYYMQEDAKFDLELLGEYFYN